MKLSNFITNFFLSLILVLLFTTPTFSQNGNQSDLFSNPIEATTTTIDNNEGSDTSTNQQSSSSQTSLSIKDAQIDRAGFEQIVQIGGSSEAIEAFEEAQAVEFAQQLGLNLYGKIPSLDETALLLGKIYQETGKKAVLNYIFGLQDKLETITVSPVVPKTLQSEANRLIATNSKEVKIAQTVKDAVVRQSVPQANREALEKVLKQFRNEITNPRKIGTTSYLPAAQQLYKWLITPIEPQLQANKADIVLFAMDSGLRSIPLAALHDGKQFLIEKYAVALVPSFGLTDTRYVDITKLPILAMGASEFKDQNPLPAVPTELSNIVNGPWRGQVFTNENFTVENFKSINQKQQFGIVHLATHGEFKPGTLSNSYIQFWDNKLGMDRARKLGEELGWTSATGSPVELMVLSACRTAVGDEQAELGFAGLAVQSGIKSAVASLWYVSDTGTLALMTEFYKQLSLTQNKAQALRQAQLAMLKGNIRIEGGQLRGINRQPISLPSVVANAGGVDLSHPFFWSAFTLIGNWN